MVKLCEKALEGLQAGLAALGRLVADLIGKGVQKIRDAYLEALTAARGLAGRILTGLGDGLAGIAGAVAAKITAAIGAITAAFVTAYNTAKAFGGQIFKGIEKSLASLGSAVAGWITKPINAIIDAINNFKIPGLGKIEIAGVTVFPGTPRIDPILTIPRLAEGGIVKRPTIAMIGEGGPEAIVPLGRAAAASTVNIYVAGTVVSEYDLAETVRRVFADIARRNGGSALPGVA